MIAVTYIILRFASKYYQDNSYFNLFDNITSEKEITNLELAQMIAGFMGKELKYRIVNFHQSRPGHDLRYALDGSKLASMGYKIPLTIEDSLRKTVEWTLNNRKWLEM